MLTYQEQKKVLMQIGEFLDDIGWKCEMREEDEDIPALLIAMDGEDIKEEELPDMALCTFIPLNEEQVEYSHLIQLYAPVKEDTDGIAEIELLDMANRLNQILPVGTAQLMDATEALPRHIAVRYVWMYNTEEPLREETLTEALLLLMTYIGIAEGLLEARRNGVSFRAALEELDI